MQIPFSRDDEAKFKTLQNRAKELDLQIYLAQDELTTIRKEVYKLLKKAGI
jgi:hypothetical protein